MLSGTRRLCRAISGLAGKHAEYVRSAGDVRAWSGATGASPKVGCVRRTQEATCG